jgi:hypothetical protein
MARSNSKSEFAERLTWPIWLWLFSLLMIASIYLTIWAPFGNFSAAITSLITTAGFIYSSQKSRLETVVLNGWLYVGNAKIEKKYISRVSVLSKDQFIRLNGVGADPACFTATRFWVSTGVMVELRDRNDPTPYWIISSKKAKMLAKALI